MSIPSKKYFIVLDKGLQKGNDLSYYVNFFYLKSFKRKTSKFSYINQPFFQGYVIIGSDMRNKLRPLSFFKINKENIQEPLNPKLFKKFILSENNVFIGLSNQTDMDEFKPIKSMLTNFQFDINKIKLLTFCSNCLEKRQFKILNKNFQIKAIKNQIICPDCALEQVIKQAEIRGLIPNKRINPKLKNFSIRL